ncbi:6607_t:CDS:2, partial [Gigaspora margarita]
KTELQTKLDLATKTKEELAEELQKEKGWWDEWINDKKNLKSRPLFQQIIKKSPYKEIVSGGALNYAANLNTLNSRSVRELLLSNLFEVGGPGKGNIKKERRKELPEMTSNRFCQSIARSPDTMKDYDENKSFVELRE